MSRIISRYAFGIVKRIMPKISATEKAALNSGSVSIEGDIFNGKININEIVDKYNIKLKNEEIEFLNNETNTLCELIDNEEVERNQNLSNDTWDYIKKNKFMGLVIPQKYNGQWNTPLNNLNSIISTLIYDIMSSTRE